MFVGVSTVSVLSENRETTVSIFFSSSERWRDKSLITKSCFQVLQRQVHHPYSVFIGRLQHWSSKTIENMHKP